MSKIETTLPEIKNDVETVQTRLQTMEIATDDQYEEAGEFLNKISATEKIVKNYYEPDRKTTYDMYQAVMDDIKRFTKPLDKAKSATKKMMQDYLRKKDQEAEKARQAALTAAQESTDAGGPPPAPPEVDYQQPKAAGTATYDHWMFEITDISKVKPEFLIVDERKISALVSEMHEMAADIVGGIKVTKEKRVKARGR